MTRAEEIAGKLTKAQCNAIRSATKVEWLPGRDRYRANGSWMTTNVLFDHFLTDHDEYLTGLGMEVRKALMEKDG